MSKDIAGAKYRLDIIALAFTLLMQFGAVCWYASSFNQMINKHSEQIENLRPLTSRVDKLETRMNAVENNNDGIDDIKKEVGKINVSIGEIKTEIKMLK